MKKLIFTLITTITLLLLLPNFTAQAEGVGTDKTIINIPNSMNIENPSGVLVTPDGEIYYSSEQTHKIYSLYQGAGDIFAGLDIDDDNGEPMSGLFDGVRSDALFHAPAGIDMDNAGNMYVADSGNHAIRVIGADGKVTTLAGDGIFGKEDGKGDNARFNQPLDVAVTKDGIVYVADTLNHVIRKIDVNGTVSTLTKDPDRLVKLSDGQVTFGGNYKDGTISDAMFNEPSGLVIDGKGNLYVADTGNNVIRYIDFKNDRVSTVAGKADAGFYNNKTLYLDGGFADGTLDQAEFRTPKGLTLTNSDNLIVADTGNSQMRFVNVADGTVSTLTEAGDVSFPTHVSITKTGDLVVTETHDHGLKKIVLWDQPSGYGDYDSVMKQYDDEKKISKYAFDGVYQVQRLEIMVGSEGEEYLFSPSKNLTRAQFSKMIVNALNLRAVVNNREFPDVKKDVWYADYVHTAAAYGIVNGFEDGNFRPNDPITRQQIAIMVGRAMNWSTDGDVEDIYKDQHKISDEALPFVFGLYEKGVMRGNEIGYFTPQDKVPREMGAVVMARLLLNE